MPPLIGSERGYRLRGRLQTWRFVARRHRVRIGFIAIGLVGVAFEVLAGSRNGIVGVAGGIIAALQVVQIALDLREVERDGSRYFFGAPRDTSVLDDVRLSDRYTGFERFVAPRGAAVRSRQLDVALWDGADRPIVLDATAWAMPVLAARLLHFVLRQRQRSTDVVYDAAKVGLRTDLSMATFAPEAPPIRLQRTSYFASEVSNELTGRVILERGTDAVVYDGRSMAVAGDVLRDLEGGALSNHIGVSTLAVTSDGFLILTLQSSGSAQDPTGLVPSGSGSADLEDADGAGTFGGFVRTAMDRELSEECGLPRGAITTRLCGYARLLHRGGKPDLFGLSRLAVPLADVRVVETERPFVSTHRSVRIDRSDAAALRASLAAVADDATSGASFTLRLALRIVDDLLVERPDEVLAFLRGA